MSGISVSEDPTTHRILIQGPENRRFNFTASFRTLKGDSTAYNSVQNGFAVEEAHYPCGTIYISTCRISNGDKKNFYSLPVKASETPRPIRKTTAPAPFHKVAAAATPSPVASPDSSDSPHLSRYVPPPSVAKADECAAALSPIPEIEDLDLCEQDDDFEHLEYLTEEFGMNFEDAMEMISRENEFETQQELKDRLEHERICRELGLPLEVESVKLNIDAPVFVPCCVSTASI